MSLKAFLFKNTSAKQTAVKNTFWLVAGEVFGRLIRATIVIYSARLLGAAEYGVFYYAMAIAAFMTVFSDIGVTAVLTRESVKDPEDQRRHLASAFILKLILIAINVAVVLWLVPLITKIEGATELLPLVAIMVVFESLREFGFGLNRALEKMEREAAVKITLNTSIAILGFIALVIQPSAYAMFWAYILGALIGFLMTLWFLRGFLKDFFSHADRHLLIPIIKVAWPIGLLSVLGAIMINTDMIMLGWLLPAEQVGFYASAQKIILLLYIFPSLLASAVFPLFTRLVKQNPDRFPQVLEKTVSAALMIALPLSVGGILLSKGIISLLYGAAYLPAATAFALLCATFVIVFPSTIITNALFAHNQQKKFVWFVALGALSNAFLNYLWIPKYGIEGAAWATVASQLLSNLFVWIQMKRVTPFAVIPRLLRVLLAAGVMGLSIAGLQTLELPVLIPIFAGGLIYFAILWLSKEPLLREGKSLLSQR